MRIGEFAKKHGVTQDTIRHYLDLGLLVTEKSGGQYKFNQRDSKDLEKIIELKMLEFSLTDVKRILAVQRISGTNTDTFQNIYLDFLEHKKDEVNNELIKFKNMNNFLEDKINNIKIKSSNPEKILVFL